MKNKRGTVFVDVDGVCANIIEPWLAMYNKDYRDKLTPADITSWDTHTLVKKECGTNIYRYLDDERLYKLAMPIEGAREGVEKLRNFVNIVFATSCTRDSIVPKYDWLVRYGFTRSIREFIVVSDKSLLLGNFLIDDRLHNVNTFTGIGVLLDSPWNQGKEEFPVIRKNTWEEIVAEILFMELAENIMEEYKYVWEELAKS